MSNFTHLNAAIMKFLLHSVIWSILIAFSFQSAFADVPAKFQYQAVLRDSGGHPIESSDVDVNIVIKQGSPDGEQVFTETHHTKTNEMGLINLMVGSENNLNEIDWEDGSYFIEVIVDDTSMGTTQLLSVPYALHAGSADQITGDLEETDPIFNAAPASDIDADDILNWNEAFNWGNHAAEGYLTEESQTLSDVLQEGNDADAQQIINLGEPGGADHAATKGYVDAHWEDFAGSQPGEMKYWDGEEWQTVVPGEDEQQLTYCGGVPVWGPCPDYPELTTAQAENITENSAISGGNVTNDGGAEVTVYGVVWDTEEEPSIEDNLGYTEDGEGLGSFNSLLTNLDPETTYYVRAYATNVMGTAYGNEISFETLQDDDADEGTVVDIDGNVYSTVVIDGVEWMAENLRTTRYANSDSIEHITANSEWETTTGAYSYFDNDEGYAEPYGALYNWYAVNDERGLCPAGWRVPTDEEWTDLTDYLGGLAVSGGKLKATGNLDDGDGLWSPPNTGATNESGFTALPAGMRARLGWFWYLNDIASFWTATERNEEKAWGRRLTNLSQATIRTDYLKPIGYSIRCIKDD